MKDNFRLYEIFQKKIQFQRAKIKGKQFKETKLKQEMVHFDDDYLLPRENNVQNRLLSLRQSWLSWLKIDYFSLTKSFQFSWSNSIIDCNPKWNNENIVNDDDNLNIKKKVQVK